MATSAAHNNYGIDEAGYAKLRRRRVKHVRDRGRELFGVRIDESGFCQLIHIVQVRLNGEEHHYLYKRTRPPDNGSGRQGPRHPWEHVRTLWYVNFANHWLPVVYEHHPLGDMIVTVVPCFLSDAGMNGHERKPRYHRFPRIKGIRSRRE